MAATSSQHAPVDPTRLVLPTLLGFLLVAASPSVNQAAWTPRAAVLLVLAALAVRPICVLLRSRDLRMWVVIGFAAVGLVSALASPQPALATVGQYGAGTGAIFIAALAGMYALGRSASRDTLRPAAYAIVGAAAANAIVGVIQAAVDAPFFPFEAYYGTRASGLLGNPVHLGTVAAAAAVFVAAAFTGRFDTRLLALAMCAAGVQASGSRASVVVLLLVPLVAAVRGRHWRPPVVAIAGVAVGMAFVSLVSSPDAAGGAGRVIEGEAAGGLRARVLVWRAAGDAIAERPLLGHGPNRFRSAHQPHRTLEAAKAEGPDRLFGDAHNLFVEYTTTTGIVGAGLLLAVLVLGLARGVPQWRLLALGLLIGHMVQPQMVASTPLLFFALGAGHPRLERPLYHRPLDLIPVVSAVAAAAVLLVCDFAINQARLDLHVDDAEMANSLVPIWPTTASAVAQTHSYNSRVGRDGAEAEEAVRWRRRALSRDETSAYGWTALGDEHFGMGDFDLAARAYRGALARDPFSVNALNGLFYVAIANRDAELARTWGSRSLNLEPNQPTIENLFERLPRE